MNRFEKGRLGEGVAADYLRANGFKIVKENFRCRLGEIDIIARKGGELFFVEVKARRSERFGSPLESVTLNKQRKIIKISKIFLLRQKREINCHFSVLGIILGDNNLQKINFIADAFEES